MKINLYTVLVCFLIINITLVTSSNNNSKPTELTTKKTMYGNVTGKYPDHIEGAITETVEIYPQKEADSDETIVRDGLLVCYKGAQATILICHGFMSDQHDSGILRRIFSGGKYNCMTFNFRAHGPKEQCKGQYCTLGRDEAFDVKAAVLFLQKYSLTKGKPIFAYGFSMGSVAAIQAQAKSNNTLFCAMILDCPFDSSQNIIRRSLNKVQISILGKKFEMPGVTFLRNYAFHPYVQSMVKSLLKAVASGDVRGIDTYICPITPSETIKQVSVPCFFIHCKKDEYMSLDAIKSMYAGVPALYKKLWITEGRWHFDSYFHNPEKYQQFVINFIEEILKGKAASPCSEIIEDSINIFDKATNRT